ncbi:hypothetical protein VNO77_44020 [Canavalia gladiata]|uniref:Uncharacterized protein n=1 Tax=Canavalia gladiata TaxID=3824 RepID=A0AAN9JV98_CANGL
MKEVEDFLSMAKGFSGLLVVCLAPEESEILIVYCACERLRRGVNSITSLATMDGEILVVDAGNRGTHMKVPTLEDQDKIS